ncbi:MAG: hypothetical protein ABI597_04005 [Gammaproteobacteria bacterium]
MAFTHAPTQTQLQSVEELLDAEEEKRIAEEIAVLRMQATQARNILSKARLTRSLINPTLTDPTEFRSESNGKMEVGYPIFSASKDSRELFAYRGKESALIVEYRRARQSQYDAENVDYLVEIESVVEHAEHHIEKYDNIMKAREAAIQMEMEIKAEKNKKKSDKKQANRKNTELLKPRRDSELKAMQYVSEFISSRLRTIVFKFFGEAKLFQDCANQVLESDLRHDEYAELEPSTISSGIRSSFNLGQVKQDDKPLSYIDDAMGGTHRSTVLSVSVKSMRGDLIDYEPQQSDSGKPPKSRTSTSSLSQMLSSSRAGTPTRRVGEQATAVQKSLLKIGVSGASTPTASTHKRLLADTGSWNKDKHNADTGNNVGANKGKIKQSSRVTHKHSQSDSNSTVSGLLSLDTGITATASPLQTIISPDVSVTYTAEELRQIRDKMPPSPRSKQLGDMIASNNPELNTKQVIKHKLVLKWVSVQPFTLDDFTVDAEEDKDKAHEFSNCDVSGRTAIGAIVDLLSQTSLDKNPIFVRAHELDREIKALHECLSGKLNGTESTLSKLDKPSDKILELICRFKTGEEKTLDKGLDPTKGKNLDELLALTAHKMIFDLETIWIIYKIAGSYHKWLTNELQAMDIMRISAPSKFNKKLYDAVSEERIEAAAFFHTPLELYERKYREFCEKYSAELRVLKDKGRGKLGLPTAVKAALFSKKAKDKLSSYGEVLLILNWEPSSLAAIDSKLTSQKKRLTPGDIRPLIPTAAASLPVEKKLDLEQIRADAALMRAAFAKSMSVLDHIPAPAVPGIDSRNDLQSGSVIISREGDSSSSESSAAEPKPARDSTSGFIYR